MPRTLCVWPKSLGACALWLCYTVVIFLWLYLSIQSFLWVGLRSQCINCTNHTNTVVHAQDMVCMALFVRYMYSAAVLGRGNFLAALSVHTILPVGRTVRSVH